MRFRPWMLVSLLVSACVGWGDGLRHPERVNDGLAARLRQSLGTTVSLYDVTPFGWNRVYIFGPRTPLSAIRDSLRLTGAGADSIARELGRGIAERDDINLLVFRFEHAGLQSMTQSHAVVAFGPQVLGRGYSSREAVFVVQADTSARGRVLNLAPPPAGRPE
jgi:hypothetical protein